MNKFIQHIPTFVELDEYPKPFEFTTQEELITHLKESHYGNKEGSWFALSENLVMEVSDQGYHWWVCGKVKSLEGLHLPKWKAMYREPSKPVKGGYDPTKCVVSTGGVILEGFSEDIVTVEKQP